MASPTLVLSLSNNFVLIVDNLVPGRCNCFYRLEHIPGGRRSQWRSHFYWIERSSEAAGLEVAVARFLCPQGSRFADVLQLIDSATVQLEEIPATIMIWARR